VRAATLLVIERLRMEGGPMHGRELPPSPDHPQPMEVCFPVAYLAADEYSYSAAKYQRDRLEGTTLVYRWDSPTLRLAAELGLI
jgi:hypothetical protein